MPHKVCRELPIQTQPCPPERAAGLLKVVNAPVVSHVGTRQIPGARGNHQTSRKQRYNGATLQAETTLGPMVARGLHD